MKIQKLLLLPLIAALIITSAVPTFSASVNNGVSVKIRVYPMLDYDNVGKFSEGLAYVKKGNKYGFINSWGQEVIPLQYDLVFSGFSEGLAAVQKGGNWGFIDKTGKTVIKFEYEGVGSFSDGLARIMKDGKWGFIDKTGKIVIQPIYLVVNDFKEGLAAVYNGNVFKRNLPKYITGTNPSQYDYSVVYADNDGKWGFIDKTGKEVIPFEYDDIHGFYKDESSYGGIVYPNKYFGDGGLAEGLAGMCKDMKWGYIDRSGETVIPFKYDEAYHFSDGLAIVKTKRNAKMEEIIIGGGVGGFTVKNNCDKYYIDKTGKVIITVEDAEPVSGFGNGFFGISSGIDVSPFSSGLARMDVSATSSFKFIDTSGKSVIVFSTEQYDYVYSFDTDGLATVSIGKGLSQLFGCVDKTGKEVVPTIYNYVNDFNEGLSAVYLEGKWGILQIVGYGK